MKPTCISLILLTIFVLPAVTYAADAGSVLFYNIYTSGGPTFISHNTRISLTNTNETIGVTVQLNFIAGATNSAVSSFAYLEPNQTVSFLASDIDPGVTGYVMAVAVDSNSGRPIKFNHLIGDYFVKLPSGHSANLRAEAFSAIADDPGVSSLDGTSSTLKFNGVNYTPAPGTLGLSSFRNASTVEPEGIILVVLRIGDFGEGYYDETFTLSGLLFNDKEDCASFSHSVNGSQLVQHLSNDFPRTIPRFQQLVPPNHSGWMKLWENNGGGLLGSVLVFNSNTSTDSAFSGGRNLHHLSLTNSASVTISVIKPSY